MKPFKVTTARKDKNGKTRWTNIGVAFPRDNGGFSIVLDALPLGNEMMIFPPDAEGSGRGEKASQPDEDNVPY
jgi:hypothetical protein